MSTPPSLASLCIALLLIVMLLQPAMPLKVISDMDDEKFGFHSGNITVDNMQPHRVGSCQKKGKSNGIYACSPDFMFVGASKSGTSSLAEYLQSHPMLKNVNEGCSDCSNEAHIFDTIKDMRDIVTQVITRQPPIKNLDERHLVMEYTPNYLLIDDVPYKIMSAFPDTYKKLKLIVLLRDPTARAISSFKAKADKHPEFPKFDVCMKNGFKQGQCIEECWRDGFFNQTKINKDCNINFCRTTTDKSHGGVCGAKSTLAHIVKSMYYYQLLNWLNVFDRSQFLILTIEQYTSNPIWVYEKVINFLGLPLYDPKGVHGFQTRSELVNLLRLRKNITPPNEKVDKQITAQTIEDLNNFYRPHNKRLVELLGWNPGYAT